MEAKPDLNARIAEWNLKPEDIKSEFETSGRITRSRTAGAGEPTGPMDDVLVSQIKSKFGDNADTSGLKLEVTAEKGVVTLNGSAHSLDQIGKAIAVALDTPGVTQTISLVKLDATP
jgi:osmotically-inducible protein OsmY